MTDAISFDEAAARLVEIGRFLDGKGWSPATSGNYSAKLSDRQIAITVSGRHKGRLTQDDIMLVDDAGHSLDGKKPSAETLLHTALYRLFPEVGSVLHTHSIATVVLSRTIRETALRLHGYELLKAFPGMSDHEAEVLLPIFDNSQDMELLAEQVNARLLAGAFPPAYLIRGHGLYGWGRSIDEAARVVEAAETMIACELEQAKLDAGGRR